MPSENEITNAVKVCHTADRITKVMATLPKGSACKELCERLLHTDSDGVPNYAALRDKESFDTTHIPAHFKNRCSTFYRVDDTTLDVLADDSMIKKLVPEFQQLMDRGSRKQQQKFRKELKEVVLLLLSSEDLGQLNQKNDTINLLEKKYDRLIAQTDTQWGFVCDFVGLPLLLMTGLTGAVYFYMHVLSADGVEALEICGTHVESPSCIVNTAPGLDVAIENQTMALISPQIKKMVTTALAVASPIFLKLAIDGIIKGVFSVDTADVATMAEGVEKGMILRSGLQLMQRGGLS